MPRSTIEEVAALAGVSRSTVSRVVNGSTAVSAEALAAVQRAIAELNYAPNRAARSLASRNTQAIGLVVPEDTTRFFGDPFLASVVAGIGARLADSDYILNLLIANDDAGGKMVRFVRNGAVDAAIIVSHHASDTFVESIADAVPVVFGGRPAVLRDTDIVIDVDNAAAAREAVAHLLALGRRRIATITGTMTMSVSMDRRDGFLAELADAGLESAGEVDGGFSEQGGADAARQLLAQPEVPDAIFAASDLMARGAIAVLRSAGLRVPEDVAVIGFDDSVVATASDLTSVRQPMFHQGEILAELTIDLLSGHRPPPLTLLPTELVVRGSAPAAENQGSARNRTSAR
ncbi:LacI family DNA-binding transcriptional regulator [Microbacterium sp. ARD32]|uniref:LacI family DNA-binding transcriptional regulator n=1 Tax=Microbacterium sp. ARD32 TaxID=2962577 RepID=UPI0028815028|nr:LacI family DNA-binding transcriptional regulator [Microbacterium sp. ARD32]MDT0156054.1 LacI family DNA-binding transcriptional regulator [Microbacterium sp. ARD32]